MFFACEALLLRGGNDFTVVDQRGGTIVVISGRPEFSSRRRAFNHRGAARFAFAKMAVGMLICYSEAPTLQWSSVTG